MEELGCNIKRVKSKMDGEYNRKGGRYFAHLSDGHCLELPVANKKNLP